MIETEKNVSIISPWKLSRCTHLWRRMSNRQYFCILVIRKKKARLLRWNWGQIIVSFTKGRHVWWSCFADKPPARWNPCKSACVTHAKWRTVVLYGQSNIVLGCRRCTWWYGANRGICQMQSGVMEERDTAKGIENKGEEQLEPGLNLYGASAVRGQRPKHTHTQTHYNKL